MSSPMSREERSQRLTAAFEWPMLIACLLVVPTIAIEYAGVGAGWTIAATILNWLIWLAFLTEFVVLLVVAPDRRQWLISHPLELAIVLLTPPFGPPGLQSARAFRLLRLLRLVRVAKLGRSLFSLNGIKWAALVAFLLIEACGVALVVIEGHQHHPHLTTFDGLWWAMTTVTTVGYGDISPLTDPGRLVAMFIMIVGLGFVAIITGAVARHILRSDATEQQDANTEEILGAVHELRGHIHDLSARLDRLETQLDPPSSSANPIPRQQTNLRRSRTTSPGHRASRP